MRVCRVCGSEFCNSPSHPGAGLKINRIDRDTGDFDNMKILIATETVYLTNDKTERVAPGDERAAWLLVRAGSPIAPEVAEFWSIATKDGQAISKMPRNADEERKGMVTPGTPPQVAENYDRMQITRQVSEEIKANLTSKGNPGAGRQAALMSAAIVNQKTGNVGENYLNPQDVLAVGSTGYRPTGEREAAGEGLAEESATLSNQDETGAKETGDAADTPGGAANVKTKEIGGGKATGTETGEGGDAAATGGNDETGEKTGDAEDATSKLLSELSQKDADKPGDGKPNA